LNDKILRGSLRASDSSNAFLEQGLLSPNKTKSFATPKTPLGGGAPPSFFDNDIEKWNKKFAK
jgi:hypothetical protein